MSDLSLATKPADELADRWEVRALRAADGKTRSIVIAILAAEVPSALPVFLRVAFPGFEDINFPAFIGYAAIQKNGSITSHMIDADQCIMQTTVYASEDEFRRDFRDLADRIKTTDFERIELFNLIQKWVVADLRVNYEGKKVTH